MSIYSRHQESDTDQSTISNASKQRKIKRQILGTISKKLSSIRDEDVSLITDKQRALSVKNDSSIMLEKGQRDTSAKTEPSHRRVIKPIFTKSTIYKPATNGHVSFSKKAAPNDTGADLYSNPGEMKAMTPVPDETITGIEYADDFE